ncbi:hypothetical protein MRX96_058413 [Rhipicephalus microplus]
MGGAAAVSKGPGRQVTECRNQNSSSRRSTPALGTVKQHVSITGQVTVASIQWVTPQALPSVLLDTGQRRCLSQLNGLILNQHDIHCNPHGTSCAYAELSRKSSEHNTR